MSLSSLQYMIFLLPCVLLHRIVRESLEDTVLLAASVVFYLHAMPRVTPWMMLYVLFIWALGFAARPKRGGGAQALFAAAGVACSICLLLVVKYAAPVLGVLPGQLEETRFVRSIIAPVGISYITFQCISYLIEIAKGRMMPERNAVRFFLYVLFFAKVTAGPIEPPAAFLLRLKKRVRVSAKATSRGLLLMMRGLLRKIVIADVLGAGVDAVYVDIGAQGSLTILLAVCMYSLQIYCDFSGYTDLARGSALLFGIELGENFRRPYTAETIREFWNRWHISLSRWLRDYIYIPLGGNRCSAVRRCLNILLTFLVSGIWHGASLTFVVWGVLHGLLQAGGILFDAVQGGKKKRSRGGSAHRLFRMARTFLLVSFCWIFFRAGSLSEAVSVLRGLVSGTGHLLQGFGLLGLSVASVGMMVMALLAIRALNTALIEPLAKETTRGVPGSRRIAFLSVLTIWIICLVSSTVSGSASFIYFDF